MKTIESLKSEIGLLKKGLGQMLNDRVEIKVYEREKKRAEARVKFINACILYIETTPREEFVNGQLKKINISLASIRGICKTFKTKEAIQQYKKDNGFKKLITQQKTLQYIIG